MQGCADTGARTRDIARVLRYLRLEEHDVEFQRHITLFFLVGTGQTNKAASQIENAGLRLLAHRFFDLFRQGDPFFLMFGKALLEQCMFSDRLGRTFSILIECRIRHG